MKRKISIFLTILMLLGCTAFGEQIHIDWTVGQTEEADQSSCTLTQMEDGWLITSDWLGEYAVFVDETNKIIPSPTEYRKDRWEEIKNAVQRVWTEWMEHHPGTIRTGLFSGDAFEQAHTETKREISWADLGILISAAEREIQDTGLRSWAEQATADIRNLAISSETRFILRTYDDSRFFSVTAQKGEATVGTLSVRMADSHNPTRLVAGWAEGGKDYYAVSEFGKTGSELSWQGRLLADDFHVGFKSLGNEAVICTWDGMIEQEQNSTNLTSRLIPQNGIGLFGLNATWTSDTWTLAFSAQENADPVISIHAWRQENANTDNTEGKTLVHLEQMSEKEENTLQGILYGKAIVSIYKIIQLLPAEMIQVMLPAF